MQLGNGRWVAVSEGPSHDHCSYGMVGHVTIDFNGSPNMRGHPLGSQPLKEGHGRNYVEGRGYPGKGDERNCVGAMVMRWQNDCAQVSKGSVFFFFCGCSILLEGLYFSLQTLCRGEIFTRE